MSWGPGRDEVSTLLAGRELERVAPDAVLAVRLLADSARHKARVTNLSPIRASIPTRLSFSPTRCLSRSNT